MKKIFVGLALVTSFSAFAEYVPLKSLEVSCEDTSDIIDCRLPNMTEVENERELFYKNANSFISKLAFTTELFDDKIEEVVSIIDDEDRGTNVDKLYNQSIDMGRSVLKEKTSQVLDLFGDQSTVLRDINSIVLLIEKYDGLIASSDSHDVQDILNVVKQEDLKRLVLNLKSKNKKAYEEIDTFLKKPAYTISRSMSIRTNEIFKRNQPSFSAPGQLALSTISVDKVNGGSSYESSLSMVEDYKTVKKLMNGEDGQTPLSIEVIIHGMLYPESKMSSKNKYDEKTNTLSLHCKRNLKFLTASITQCGDLDSSLILDLVK